LNQIKSRRAENGRPLLSRLALRGLGPLELLGLRHPEMEVGRRLSFVALILVLLVEANDFIERLHVEIFVFGLRDNFLPAFFERLGLFLDSLDERRDAGTCASRSVGRACGRPTQTGRREGSQGKREVIDRDASRNRLSRFLTLQANANFG
jgi:hypothetical protein